MPIQSALAQVGIAKQSAKGTAAANPTFGHGVTSGTVLTLEVAQELEEHTSSARIATDINRTSVTPGMDFSCRAHSKSVGLYLFGALGSVATSGPVATIYTHTFTTGDDLPYLTAFGKMGSNLYAVNDLKVDEFTLSFEENMPVEIAVSGMGTTANYAATYVPGTDDTVASYFYAASGTFKIDVDSGTPVTAKIRSGEISISNALETILLSGSIAPSDVFPGRQEVECSFEIVPDDFADWRTIATGTSSGTTASATPVYGSFEILFTNGNDQLKLTSTKVAYVVDFPDADPAGGTVTLQLEGLCVKPSSGAALSVELKNTQASY